MSYSLTKGLGILGVEHPRKYLDVLKCWGLLDHRKFSSDAHNPQYYLNGDFEECFKPSCYDWFELYFPVKGDVQLKVTEEGLQFIKYFERIHVKPELYDQDEIKKEIGGKLYAKFTQGVRY